LSLQLELICRRPRQETKAIPLLFVHGAFCGAWVWDEHFLPFFAAQGYTAYALSLRGHGASEGHEQLQEASLKDYVDDVGEVIARLDRVPALIGHSLGGVVVQSYLRHHAIPGAVLMASGPPHGMLPCAVGMALRNPMLFLQYKPRFFPRLCRCTTCGGISRAPKANRCASRSISCFPNSRGGRSSAILPSW
jgi:pimeloyl-ACP methyl ester carboxylesterase